MLPDKSIVSIKNGAWFVYQDGENSIKISCSNLGKEKIYLNEKLISEQRSFKSNSEHSFKDENGTEYQVKFIIVNLSKGLMECLIFRDKGKVKTFRTGYNPPPKISYARHLIIIFSSIIFVLINKQLNLPKFTYFIFFACVLIIHFKTRELGEVFIEE